MSTENPAGSSPDSFQDPLNKQADIAAPQNISTEIKSDATPKERTKLMIKAPLSTEEMIVNPISIPPIGGLIVNSEEARIIKKDMEGECVNGDEDKKEEGKKSIIKEKSDGIPLIYAAFSRPTHPFLGKLLVENLDRFENHLLKIEDKALKKYFNDIIFFPEIKPEENGKKERQMGLVDMIRMYHSLATPETLFIQSKMAPEELSKPLVSDLPSYARPNVTLRKIAEHEFKQENINDTAKNYLRDNARLIYQLEKEINRLMYRFHVDQTNKLKSQ
jgi:hypothetical protein